MARPPGSCLCLLVLLSQILPPAVATDQGLSKDKLPQGTEEWIPGKHLKADGTWEQGHTRATASRTPAAADGLEKAWGLPVKGPESLDGKDKSTEGKNNNNNITTSSSTSALTSLTATATTGETSSSTSSSTSTPTSPTATTTTGGTSSSTSSSTSALTSPTATTTTGETSSSTSSSTSALTSPTATTTTGETSSSTSALTSPTATTTTGGTSSSTSSSTSTPTSPTATTTTGGTSSSTSSSTSALTSPTATTTTGETSSSTSALTSPTATTTTGETSSSTSSSTSALTSPTATTTTGETSSSTSALTSPTATTTTGETSSSTSSSTSALTSPTATTTTGETSSSTSALTSPTATTTTGETSSSTSSSTSALTSPTATTTTGETSSSTSALTSPTATTTTGETSSSTSAPTSPTATTTTGDTSSSASASTSPTPTHTTTSLASSTTEIQVTSTAAPISSATQNPCLNSGKWNGTHCRCAYGYEGKRCQNKVEENPFCKNGGNWIDNKCECGAAYTGPYCEYVVENIKLEPPKIVEAQVEVSLRVQQNFSKELKNQSSGEFLRFNETFTMKMDVIYNEIHGYKGVRILQLSPGSVVVEHEVLLETKFTQDFKKVLKNMMETVKDTITSAIDSDNCTRDELCFSKDSQSLNVSQSLNYSYDPDNECKKKVGKELAEFFYTEYKDKKLSCVSLCTPGFNRSVNCNRGKCELERSGPKCYCTDTDTHWYSGATCENRTSKTLVFGLVATAVVFALALVITLLSLMLHSKREVRRHKARAAEMEQWKAADDPSYPGSFQNMGFESSEGPQWDIPLNRFPSTANLLHPGNQIKIRTPNIMTQSR